MLNKLVALATSILVLAGCSTGRPGKFYGQGRYTPAERSKDKIQVHQSYDFDAVLAEYQRDGYKIVGESEFVGSYVDTTGFKRQARKVKASLVIVRKRFVGSQAGVVVTAVAGPSGGYGYASPYSSQDYEIHGVFLAK